MTSPTMYDQLTERPHSMLIIFLLSISILSAPSLSSADSYIFYGCSQLKYDSGSTYSSDLNLLLSSLVSSAASLSYNNLTVVSRTSQITIFGLFQCRGDLDSTSCGKCVADAVGQLATVCTNSCGGALQLDGCFVKYDNSSFFGVEDETVALKHCGPSISYDANMMSGFDAVMAGLESSGGAYRVSGSGDFRGVAQCVGDLSSGQCQDCLSTAIGGLKDQCGSTNSGDMFLATCYARFSMSASYSPNGNNGDTNNDGNQTDKTLAISIALFVGILLLIWAIAGCLRRLEKRKGGK